MSVTFLIAGEEMVNKKGEMEKHLVVVWHFIVSRLNFTDFTSDSHCAGERCI